LVIEIAKEDSITQAAEKFFRRYTKARNAVTEIAQRLTSTEQELETLGSRAAELEKAIDSGDEEFVKQAAGTRAEPSKARTVAPSVPAGARKFISSDGLEILVGKKAIDNDQLTFRTAKSLDLWMHAADYPGSHVVVRNPNRKEIPQKTLLEAAQLAAFYSQGKSQPKAAVHYTQKKYVNKPRGSAPGLVSLAKFKTILVEPKVPDSIVKS
jgi:predicted ribosome quality control (RQC) complex YloA/Tae2 family protein